MRARDLVMRSIARLAALGWFRSVETSGVERVPSRGPTLVVANHDGGFVDPVLLAATLPRFPRFLAMASLVADPGSAVPGARRSDPGGPRVRRRDVGERPGRSPPATTSSPSDGHRGDLP